jgi:ribosomal protein RSM22 (predicted rRNA methylase)
MLPAELTAALDAELHGVPAAALARNVDELTRRYHEPGRGRPVLRSDADVRAYLAYRLPATYAAVAAALDATAERLPAFAPRTVLDLGSGPGTALWAVSEIWPSIERFVAIEADPRMAATGRRLAREEESTLRTAQWLVRDMTAPEPLPPCELAIAAYALGELAPAQRDAVVRRLWQACCGTVVLIESGTPAGFRTIQACREALIGMGAHTIAPCPHDGACPLLDTSRWCHFVVRLERSRIHRLAKRSTLSYEDEPYAYVALSREPVPPIAARVIGHPRSGSGHVEIDLCTPSGVQRQTLSRRNGDAYRAARRLRWGAAIEQMTPEH